MSVLANVSGGVFADVIIWVRRIIKSPSTQSISDGIIADYINRFLNFDFCERIQLYEFKKNYTFVTKPNVFQYQAPFYPSMTPTFPGPLTGPPFDNNPTVSQPQTPVPVYNQFKQPVYCDGVQMGWYQSQQQFYNVFPEIVYNEQPLQGNGTPGPYTVTFGENPVLQGFVDQLGNLSPYVFFNAFDTNGNQMYIVDSGYYTSTGLGILIQTDSTFQNIIGPNLTGSPPNGGGSGTVNYATGVATFTFNTNVMANSTINSISTPFSAGFPRICLYYNNIFKLYPVPDLPYKIQMEAYVTPSVFFNTQDSMPFAYMSEYIALGLLAKSSLTVETTSKVSSTNLASANRKIWCCEEQIDCVEKVALPRSSLR